ncbi:MAG: hypothetical protein WBX25_03315 [Rhodomicrobium sp.]
MKKLLALAVVAIIMAVIIFNFFQHAPPQTWIAEGDEIAGTSALGLACYSHAQEIQPPCSVRSSMAEPDDGVAMWAVIKNGHALENQFATKKQAKKYVASMSDDSCYTVLLAPACHNEALEKEK